jgi:DNA-binding protein Fis
MRLKIDGVPRSTMQKQVAAGLKDYLEKYPTKKQQDPFGVWSMMLRQLEPVVIAMILRHTDGNKARAARILGINRTSLYNKMRAYKIIEECQPLKRKRQH